MQVGKAKAAALFSDQKQYVIPLFQRLYSWESKHWKALWEDLIGLLAEDSLEATHFTGSIVLMPEMAVPAGVQKLAVIDGQQRLTTFCILFMALRDRAKSNGDEKVAGQIEDIYLKNQYADLPLDRIKLLPTQADRENFEALANGEKPPAGTLMTKAYSFFADRILRSNFETKQIWEAVSKRMELVTISIEDGDNPYEVFESLNYKGKTLTAADLIRNHIFMQVDSTSGEQEQLHSKHWAPMERRLTDLEAFFFHFLQMDGTKLNKRDIFVQFKGWMKGKSAAEALRLLDDHSKVYYQLLFPEDDLSLGLRHNDAQVLDALKRLRKLNFTVTYPLAMRLLYGEQYGTSVSRVNAATVVFYLLTAENYVIRRAVTGRGSQGANRTFQGLAAKTKGLDLDHDRFVSDTRDYIVSQNYPADDIFAEALIYNPIYHSAGDRLTHVRALLAGLEAEHGHKEAPNVDVHAVTIEHIIPQKLTPAWEEMLGPNAQEKHEKWLHTLGNLTLTALNSELSNFDWVRKSQIYGDSNFSLTKPLSKLPSWTSVQVEERGRELTSIAIKRWPAIAPSVQQTRNSLESASLTNKKPVSFTLLGNRITVQHWYEVVIKFASELKQLDEDAFNQWLQMQFSPLSRSTEAMRTPKEVVPGVYYDGNRSALSHQAVWEQGLEIAGLQEDFELETKS